MLPKTMKMALAEMLENLTERNLEKFCHQLLDRRGEQKVRTCRVEGKSRLQIVDVLVSTFTEPGAVRVSVEILRQIHCNEEAEQLVTATTGGH
ncbi:apoptosis-associated speck-like protein containing a CARD [Cyclopterus lumpus]|uniref:apoptosis-associated speck-like protein containing a CARD n=1 Tax=Cyclopterus lumpus TaxID=8103 RepID=UPI0014865CE6|nr:apoptosis-associated speck-like protein containing a CARD [Cyclopterus lumpus]